MHGKQEYFSVLGNAEMTLVTPGACPPNRTCETHDGQIRSMVSSKSEVLSSALVTKWTEQCGYQPLIELEGTR